MFWPGRHGYRDRDQAVDGEDEDDADADDEGWLRNSWQSDVEDRSMAQRDLPDDNEEEEDTDDEEEGDAFGDDFDEFAEGEEHDDFGDFDEPEKQAPPPLPTAPDILSGLVSCGLLSDHLVPTGP